MQVVLKLDKVIAPAEAAQLLHAAFGFAFATPRRLPTIINRNAMSLGAAAIERRAVFLDVVFSAAAHEIIEFSFGQLPQAMTLAARAHLDAIYHGLIELQPFLRGRSFNINI